jgi:UDP-N-acetylmuramoylalanine--D-glutamate ligase
MHLKKRHVVIMGLGHFGGGIGAARWFALQGDRVTVTDMQPAEKLAESVSALADLPVQFALGGHPPELLDSCNLLVVSPAVDKRRSQFFQTARRQGIPYTTEINEFCRLCPAPIVGVTGSVGKSTTASMIFAALNAVFGAGRCHLGGNIGRSLLSRLPEIHPDHVVVLELSSFMLEDTPVIGFSPHVAVVTNLVNNHLDRHGSMEAYAEAKRNILRFQKSDDVAILNQNDPIVRTWDQYAHGRVVYFDHADMELQAPGRHNQANAAAALAVVQSLAGDARMPQAVQALTEFKSLPHRMEWVERTANSLHQSVDWLNDSKSTTPESTLTAVHAVPPGRTIVIVGGADKKADMKPLVAELVRLAWWIITIGTTGPKMDELTRSLLSDAASDRADGENGARALPKLRDAQTLEQAVEQAWQWVAGPLQQDASVSPICVLLSPACASYDQFNNYEHRGDVFKNLVAKISQSHAKNHSDDPRAV